MANAYNYPFWEDTGLEGGVTAGNNIMYIDQYNGSDVTGDGTHNNPTKSMQRAIDVYTSTTVVLIIYGYHEEGDLIGWGSGSIIANGLTTINGINNTDLKAITVNANIYYNQGYLFDNGNKNYGRLVIENFQKVSNNSASFGAYKTTFRNVNDLFASGTSNAQVRRGIKFCSFINCATIFNASTSSGTTIEAGASIEHNNFINSGFRMGEFTTARPIRSNYFDPTSKLYLSSASQSIDASLFLLDYNFYEGTLTNKIEIRDPSGINNFDNVEALKVGFPTLEVNSLPSTTNPLFNNTALDDYTLQEASPLVKAAHDKLQIGCFNVGYVINPNDPVKFDYDANVDTTTANEISLLASGVGVATTKLTQHHQIAPKKRLIDQVFCFALEQNFATGEVLGSNTSADNTPVYTDIEFKYSTSDSLTDGVDDDTTYNANWLRIPLGGLVKEDTVNNVGTDSELFDLSSSVPIKTKYIKLRITMRSNEAPL